MSMLRAATLVGVGAGLVATAGANTQLVVGREAQVIVQPRGDGSPPHSAENSYRRAYTALTYREPSLGVEKRVHPGDQLVHLKEVMGAHGNWPRQGRGPIELMLERR